MEIVVSVFAALIATGCLVAIVSSDISGKKKPKAEVDNIEPRPDQTDSVAN